MVDIALDRDNLIAVQRHESCRPRRQSAVAGVTRNAARALGLQDEIGALETGKRCDLAIWDIERPAELVYRMGANPLHARVWRGR